MSVWVSVHPTFRLEISKKYLYYTVAAVSVCQAPKRVALWESVMADRAGRVGVSVVSVHPTFRLEISKKSLYSGSCVSVSGSKKSSLSVS